MNTKINLCDTCKRYNEFPTCCPTKEVKFGDGIGNDNIIDCPNYEDELLEDSLFEGLEKIEVTVPENYTTDIDEEEKKDSEYMDGLNAQY